MINVGTAGSGVRQLSAHKSISKLLHYSAVRTIQQSTGNPAYSIASYWSSLQEGSG